MIDPVVSFNIKPPRVTVPSFFTVTVYETVSPSSAHSLSFSSSHVPVMAMLYHTPRVATKRMAVRRCQEWSVEFWDWKSREEEEEEEIGAVPMRQSHTDTHAQKNVIVAQK